MSNNITLTAEDGHELDAWQSDPADTTKGGIIILQAIYGLTSHLGDVCDRPTYERLGKHG